jgi:hypothetical protein
MWSNKIQTVGSISDFLKNGAVGEAIAPITFSDWLIHPIQTIKDVGADTAYNALHPFLDLLIGIAYPVANMLLLIAGILYILNLRERAISWLTKTSITYILINMLPMLLKAFFQLMTV